jgi:hypothetical protein
MKIYATYCSNYNGAYLLTDNGKDKIDLQDEHKDPKIRKQATECVETIIDTLVDDCDDEGEYCGPDAYEATLLIVKKFFPTNDEIVVEIDSVST